MIFVVYEIVFLHPKDRNTNDEDLDLIQEVVVARMKMISGPAVVGRIWVNPVLSKRGNEQTTEKYI